MEIVLTRKGKEALRKAWPTYRRCIRDLFGRLLQPNDAATLLRILRPFSGRAE